MNVYQWDQLTESEIAPGIHGRNVVGRNFMMCRFEYAPNVVEPVHSHKSEQLTWIVEGRVRFHSEGREIECGPGDIVHVASDKPHGMRVLDHGARLIEIFGPVRPDLILAMKNATSSPEIGR